MKSFFKKLAFVMALAMVVSLAAPAAKTAVAADKALAIGYQNGMAITEVNIANIGDGEDLRFLYAPANWKELGVKWTSSNENVATVDSNGFVTAVAAGSATVSVAVGTETASVVVNVVDLPTYTVSIGEGEDRDVTEWSLKVGEAVDFAFYGVKDYSRDKIGAASRYACQWGTDDPTVLSNDGDGVFTALKAGTAKATLMVLNVVTNQIHNVIPVTVTVAADATPTPVEIVADLNKTQNTIEVTFDKATELELADVEMYRVFNADDDNNGDGVIDARDAFEPYQDFYVYGVTANTAKTVWTLTTFDDFTDGATYEVRVDGYEPERFVASVGDVAKVVVKATEACLASDDCALVPAYLSVQLLDAKGVDVTTRKVNGVANNDTANISYDLIDYSNDYSLSYDVLEFYEDATAQVTATYQNADIDPITSTPLPVKPSSKAAYGVAEIVAWTLVAPGKWADWANILHEVPAGEEGYVIATLLKDTRGKYFTTHEHSATGAYNNWGAGYWDNSTSTWNTVYWTEDSEQEFWMNGYYVEYKAMNPDKMLVEDYGEIASYELGNARYALYLYNYTLYENEFVKELYSQYVKVCHPMELKGITANNSVSIMMNTEDTTKDELTADAYYSKFSVTTVGVTLWDIHKDTVAKKAHADAAEFEITLTSAKLKDETDASYAALKRLVEVDYLNDLAAYADGNSDGTPDHWYRAITVEANDYKDIAYRNQVKFTITEKTTGTKAYVTINLKKLVRTVIKDADGTVVYDSDVALVKELDDELKTSYLYFEKFALSKKSLSVDMAKKSSVNILLTQADANGNTIGYDSNLFIATALNATNISQVVDGDSLAQGDRIIEVKGPDGKIYSIVGTEYANPAFIKKLADTAYANASTTSALGVKIVGKSDVTDANGDPTAYNRYDFVFRTTDSDSEYIYAKEGRYNITIKTVEAVDYDMWLYEDDGVTIKTDEDGNNVANPNYGKITFASSTNLKQAATIEVSNSNAEVTYAGRDLTRIAEASLTNYVDATAHMDSNAGMCAFILDAFKFNLGSAEWKEGDWAGNLLRADDILYYTYTATPTNKQIVINTVTFKVPELDSNGNRTGNWYRSTATVNKSLTFDYE